MKSIINLLFAFALVSVLNSCKNDEIDKSTRPQAPVISQIQEYDLRSPGLTNEYVGEVKWIFCLKYGETKMLDIDGKNYLITLKDVKDTNLSSHYDLEKYRLYADILINDEKLFVSSGDRFLYGAFSNEKDITSNIIFTFNKIKECFSSKNSEDLFNKEYGIGKAINSTLKIHISGYLFVVTAFDDIIKEEYRVIFIITQKTYL